MMKVMMIFSKIRRDDPKVYKPSNFGIMTLLHPSTKVELSLKNCKLLPNVTKNMLTREKRKKEKVFFNYYRTQDP